MTLIGEARLWYESLALLDDDWPTLQNKFRWQYSEIGNTQEQLFHAWRTFKFDENTDSIDSYALRMSQVVAMLNYGEMQILENFKNTLPYRLYLTLINVNNLRDAIDLAKRVLTKEKLDRQLTGQASTPFMKATSNNDSHSPQNHQKKGVTFDTMEMLEMPMGLNISPPIWQSYINAILNCLQNRKYCEAIMGNLLLFTPTKASVLRSLKTY